MIDIGSQNALAEARMEATRRASRKCPVIKAANQILDEHDVINQYHAIKLIRIAMSNLPAGKATDELLARIEGYEP